MHKFGDKVWSKSHTKKVAFLGFSGIMGVKKSFPYYKEEKVWLNIICRKLKWNGQRIRA